MMYLIPQINKDILLNTTLNTTLRKRNSQNRGDLGFVEGDLGGTNGSI